MSYRIEKDTGDIVLEGLPNGISASPHKGIANMQNINIATENEEGMCNFARTPETLSGILQFQTNTILLYAGTVPLQIGDRITIGAGISGLAAGNYFVVLVSGAQPLQSIEISTTSGGSAITTFVSGSAEFTLLSIILTATSITLLSWGTNHVPYVNEAITLTNSTISGLSNGTYWVQDVSNVGGTYFTHIVPIYNGLVTTTWSAGSGTATATLLTISSPGVAKATEQYYNGSTLQYRYYIAESTGYVWVLDTSINQFFNLIDKTQKTGITGMAVIDGQLHIFQSGAVAGINTKWTCLLGQGSTAQTTGYLVAAMNNFLNSPSNAYAAPHYCLVGHANALSYTDGNYVATVIPDSTSSALNANVFSYGQYTSGGTVYTMNVLFAGSFPVIGQAITFNTDTTIYSGLSVDTVYYVVAANPLAATFSVSATVGGSAIDATGGAGNQYFNSYNPRFGTISGNIIGGTGSTFVGTPQACTLPSFEIAQCLVELGATMIIGTMGNSLYVWDENALAADNFLPLPESNVAWMINVNNIAYIGAGQKGNIYLTTGAIVAGVTTVPDYTAGISGAPSSYIEPYFIFGDAAFIRGRVFFSIQDQTATKTGNCGGVWSFIPTQAAFPEQDQGIALRLENQNSYGTYNGMANLIIPSQNQDAIGIQYWASWTTSLTSPNYGIDFSSTIPYTGGQSIIEYDAIPIGQILGGQKRNPSNIEFKLASPLVSGESVAINYRQNLTGAWSSAGTLLYDGGTAIAALSGYYSPLAFGNAQWLQLQAVLTSTATNPSFNRLTEVRIRNS